MAASDAEKQIIIREVVKDVWIFSRPFNLFNKLPVGGRSTAIKLNDGSVWVVASTPLTEATKTKLQELGEVKYIIAPNAFHNLYLKSFKEAYPDAKTIGPVDLNAKLQEQQGWQLDATISDTQPETAFGFEEEIDYCFFSGHKNKDIAFLHKPSKTVIAADLLFNLPANEQYSQGASKPWFPFINTWSPNSFLMRTFISLKVENPVTMKLQVAKVVGWEFDRWIPCHGDVAETGAKQLFKQAYKSHL
ncbi:hypothetical protein QCA50_013289 [Cerrena zonata]|uniref:DUF4336 domain-containing protein n=1 Tax=Cerrena zonata TaxID=2478898 RepID=A0AAW0FRI3_9APHY